MKILYSIPPFFGVFIIFVSCLCPVFAGLPYEGHYLYTITMNIVAECDYPGSSQGVTTDGTYIYVSSSSEIYKYFKNGTLISSVSNPDGGHWGDLCYANGKLYIAWCENASEIPTISGVYVYNASNLAFIQKYNITANAGAGTITYNPTNNHFYVGEACPGYTYYDHFREYDENFTLIASYVNDFRCGYGVNGLSYTHPRVDYRVSFLVTSHDTEFYFADSEFNVVGIGYAPFDKLQGVQWINDTHCLVAQQLNDTVYTVTFSISNLNDSPEPSTYGYSQDLNQNLIPFILSFAMMVICIKLLRGR